MFFWISVDFLQRAVKYWSTDIHPVQCNAHEICKASVDHFEWTFIVVLWWWSSEMWYSRGVGFSAVFNRLYLLLWDVRNELLLDLHIDIEKWNANMAMMEHINEWQIKEETTMKDHEILSHHYFPLTSSLIASLEMYWSND